MTCYLFFFNHLEQSTKKSFVIFLSCSTTIAIIQSCSPTSSLCRPASSSPSSQSSTSNPTSRRRKSWRSIVFIQSVMIFHGVLIILIRMAKMKFGLIWKYYYECHLNSIEAFFVSTKLLSDNNFYVSLLYNHRLNLMMPTTTTTTTVHLAASHVTPKVADQSQETSVQRRPCSEENQEKIFSHTTHLRFLLGWQNFF